MKLGTGNQERPQAGFDPAVDAGRENDDAVATVEGLLDGAQTGGAQDVGVAAGERLAERIEVALKHAAEVVAEEPFLRAPVVGEVQFHQHEQRTEEQQAAKECPPPAGVADEEQQRVASGQRAVEIESRNVLEGRGHNGFNGFKGEWKGALVFDSVVLDAFRIGIEKPENEYRFISVYTCSTNAWAFCQAIMFSK